MLKDLRKMLRDGDDIKNIDFKVIKKLAEIITNQISEDYFHTYESTVNKISKIGFKNLKTKRIESSIVNLSLTIKKSNGKYVYLIGNFETPFKESYIILNFAKLISSYNSNILNNVRDHNIKKLLEIAILLINMSEIIPALNKENFHLNAINRIEENINDLELEMEVLEALSIFENINGFLINKHLKTSDIFLILNPYGVHNKFNDKLKEMDGKASLKSIIFDLIKNYETIFNYKERVTVISPYRYSLVDNDLFNSSIINRLTIYDKSIKDEDLFFNIFENQNDYDYWYDFLDKLILVEEEIIGDNISFQYYILISKNKRDNLYCTVTSSDSAKMIEIKEKEPDIQRELSWMYSILDFLNSESNDSELSYMIHDTKIENKKIRKERVYHDSHITFVRGFWRRSKYGLKHFVRPSKRFYGDPNLKNSLIRTLVVLK